jgi:thioredoxin 1
MPIIKVTKDNFEEEVKNSTVPVLCDFNAGWCGPCKVLGPIVEEIASERDDIKVVSIDIDEEEDLVDEYEVFSIPCLVLVKNGEEAGRSVGLKGKAEIIDFIEGK